MAKIKITKKVIIISTVFLIVIAGGTAFALTRPTKKAVQAPDKVDEGLAQEVNLNPPTQEDTTRADENKQKNAAREQQENAQASGSSKRNVTPVITYSGQYDGTVEIGSYVSGVFEDGGICKATFNKNGRTITKSVTGIKGANSVNCPVIAVPSKDFSEKGIWSVSVNYSSQAATGNSNTVQVEVK